VHPCRNRPEQVLLNYSWPGNVRELRLAIERAGELVEDGVLPAAAVAEGIARCTAREPASVVRGGRKQGPRRSELQDAERLVSECEAASWHVGEAARASGSVELLRTCASEL